jgi:hypothetical protein
MLLSVCFWRDTHAMTCRTDFRSLDPSLLQLAILHEHVVQFPGYDVSSSVYLHRDTSPCALEWTWGFLCNEIQLVSRGKKVEVVSQLPCSRHIIHITKCACHLLLYLRLRLHTATSMVNRASSTIIILTGISQTQTPECQLPPNACR